MLGLPSRRASAEDFFLVAGGSARPGAAARSRRLEALCAQSLQVVHLLASSLRVDRSLASAVRFASAHAGGVAGEELARLEWAVRLRHFPTVDDGFFALAAAVGEADGDFKRALLTLRGAESESTREGLERRLDRAYDIVMRAEERRRDRLVSNLERPTQVLFGVGVVFPLVLASLLPMLSIGGASLGALPAGLLLVVAVPGLTLLGASKVLARNFLAAAVEARHKRSMFLAAAAAPLAGGLAFILLGAFPGLAVAPSPLMMAGVCAAAGGGCGLVLSRRALSREAEQRAMEQELPDLLHGVGTRMVAGQSAEHALLETVEASQGSSLSRRLRGLLFDVIVGRRSLADAIERDDEVKAAPRVFPALRLLAAAASRDGETAGRVVLQLSEFERLRVEAAEKMRTRVQAIVGTTRGTVAVFSPLILGITAGMFGLLASIGGSPASPGSRSSGLEAEGFAVIVVLYLCLQVALAGWFSSRLVSAQPASAFGRSLARDVPMACALFCAAWMGSASLF